MPDRTKYSFGAAPLQDPIVPGLRLTDPWRDWFVAFQSEFLVRWEDLRFPAQGINPLGAAGDPTRDAATGLFSFAAAVTNVIAGAAQLPHAWLPGSAVRPHVHLRFPTAAAGVDTIWRFEYDIADMLSDWTYASGTYAAMTDITIANPNNANRHAFGSFGDLSMTGFEESCVILWKLSRLGGAAADTDPNACLLVEFDLHYRTNKRGTVPRT